MADVSKVVIVAGAAGNLGRAVSSVLAAGGWSVVAVDRGAEGLNKLIQSLDGPERHLPVADADLADGTACEAVVAATLKRYGRLDGLVNTVGGFGSAPLTDPSTSVWDLMFTLNLKTTFNLFRAAVPPMKVAGSGSLIAIGAGAGLKGSAGLSGYAASKSALMRVVESLAEEMKGSGVRCNAVLPSTIDTPQNRAAMPDANHAAWVRPGELAEVIGFLLSDKASGVTGALVPVVGRV